MKIWNYHNFIHFGLEPDFSCLDVDGKMKWDEVEAENQRFRDAEEMEDLVESVSELSSRLKEIG